jgi:hypothetical protein
VCQGHAKHHCLSNDSLNFSKHLQAIPVVRTTAPESHIFAPESHIFAPASHIFAPESHIPRALATMDQSIVVGHRSSENIRKTTLVASIWPCVPLCYYGVSDLLRLRAEPGFDRAFFTQEPTLEMRPLAGTTRKPWKVRLSSGCWNLDEDTRSINA